ncbi:MAG: hypothetical protein Q7T83_02945 [Thermodesulfovibrionales bacterium]|nr:hypothetical protein [Thermodesulfovibrionales bacterium]
MARLPNYEKAIIDPNKIRNYILSFEHPIGRFKAAFFKGMGYTRENWEQFINDIRRYHLQLDAKPTEKNKYGQKYEINGLINGPNGKILMLRSVWIVLESEDIARFITIYPEGGSV